MRIIILTVSVIALFGLSACAGPNGEAYGSNSGSRAHTDLFKLKLP